MKTLTILSECSKLAHRSTRGGMMRLENVSIGKSVMVLTLPQNGMNIFLRRS